MPVAGGRHRLPVGFGVFALNRAVWTRRDVMGQLRDGCSVRSCHLEPAFYYFLLGTVKIYWRRKRIREKNRP